jgi:hypothetical protein
MHAAVFSIRLMEDLALSQERGLEKGRNLRKITIGKTSQNGVLDIFPRERKFGQVMAHGPL